MTAMTTPEQIPGLISWWDFQRTLTARGPHPTELTMNGNLEWVRDGAFGDWSLEFDHVDRIAAGHLSASAAEAPQLNIGGPDATFTVAAWVRRRQSDYTGCEFVAGVWNEHGRRQFGMFLNLRIWDGDQSVGAHVSSHGGATPGYPYCMDVALGATPVSFDQWHLIAITYDGTQAAAWLDGRLDAREPAGALGGNPFTMPGGLLDGDAPFTVGAVARPEKVTGNAEEGFIETGSAVANPFIGRLGGLAVFDRALSADEIASLA